MTKEPRDFTRAEDPPSFKLDNDVFFGRKKLNGGAALKFATQTAALPDDADDLDLEQLGLTLKRLFRLTLRTSSYRRMAERIDATLSEQSSQLLDELDWRELPADADDVDDELDDELLDLTGLQEIGEWLLEEYGMRPTQPSDGSSAGPPSPDDGTSSTPRDLEPAST